MRTAFWLALLGLISGRCALAQDVWDGVASRALLVQSGSWGRLSWEADDSTGPGDRTLEGQLEAVRLYGLTELTYLRTALHGGTRPVAWWLSAGSLGYDDFRVSRLTATAFLRPPRSHRVPLGGGIRVVMEQLAPRGYAATRRARLDVLWAARLHPDFVLTGALLGLIFRPHSAETGRGGASLLGALLKITDKVILVTEFAKEAAFPGSVRIGFDVAPLHPVRLRVGAANQPARIAAGIGVRQGAARVDVTLDRHYALGISSSISLSISL